MRHIIWLLLIFGLTTHCHAQFSDVKLIAHRGGIVDEYTDENSVEAISRAAQQGYYMVELDVRQSHDSVLVVQHDSNLMRVFGINRRVEDLNWTELSRYKSKKQHQVHTLEDMLKLVKAHGLQVMIDFKVRGDHPHIFAQLYGMLQKFDLSDRALIIPTAEATDYFRGKIRLSCTREQLEAYQKRPDYSPADYYLFGIPSRQDMDWAKINDIQVVGVINYSPNGHTDYQAIADSLLTLGVGYVQLDSRFDGYFKKDRLFFREGKFKIAQFTDLHWDQHSPNTKKTRETIESVLTIEKPDMVMLTGDLPSSKPAKEAWDSIAVIFERHRIPWGIILGNHDEEAGMSRAENFQYLNRKPFFIGQQGPPISGAGNYVLPIYSRADQKVRALLYALDTHNKPDNPMHGHYNWLQFDQIAWYRQQSDRYTALNGGIPLPALAFIHIPLVEYAAIHTDPKLHIGNASKGDGPGGLNSGMFVNFLEKKDVMAMFAGHNHSNDYIGQYMDIALAYGRTTGTDAYGSLERGARIIVLYQGERKFDTWIRTPSKEEFRYYYPSGISQQEEQQMAYQQAEHVQGLKPGISYRYYQGGRFEKVDDILRHGKLVTSGILDSMTIDTHMARDSFAFVFDGYIRIPKDGVYNFYTYSDDGSRLWIGEDLVVDNDGSHNERRRNGKIALKKGYHRFRVDYFDDYMGEILQVGISSRDIIEQPLPASFLFTLDN